MNYDKQLTRISQRATRPVDVLIDGRWVTLQPKRVYAMLVNRAGRGGHGRLARRVVEISLAPAP